jgi:hypothetical protein
MIANILDREYPLSPLEGALIVCHANGFEDVDAQPTGIGAGWVITASGRLKAPLKGHGSNQVQACLDLIRKVSNG